MRLNATATNARALRRHPKNPHPARPWSKALPTRRIALLSVAAATALLLPSVARAAFGFSAFGVTAEKLGGAPVTQPGSHPYALRVSAGLNAAAGESDGDLRELRLALRPGLLINPTAVSECAATSFHTHRSSPFEASQSGEKCQNATQVGVVKVKKGGETRWFGLFNLVPPFGAVASLGASPFGTQLVFNVHLREPDPARHERRRRARLRPLAGRPGQLQRQRRYPRAVALPFAASSSPSTASRAASR